MRMTGTEARLDFDGGGVIVGVERERGYDAALGTGEDGGGSGGQAADGLAVGEELARELVGWERVDVHRVACLSKIWGIVSFSFGISQVFISLPT